MSTRWIPAFVIALAALLAPATDVRAGIIYDEAIDGDFSGDGLVPTSLAFGPGSNLISGTTGRDELGVIDRDYFTFTVEPGYAFISLIELAGTTVVRNVGFLAIQAGPQVTVPVSPNDASGLLGWAHFEPVDADIDILPNMGVSGGGSTGFLPPLPAGQYAIWIQETATGTSSYAFDFQVVPVPEPALALSVLLGLAALGGARLRRRTI
jgi:hypothetical protein